LINGGLGAVEKRLDSFSTDLYEEKERLVELLVCAFATVALGLMGLVLLSFTLVALFWETARVPALIGMCVLYVGGTIWVYSGLKSRLKQGPAPFADSLNELRKDRAWLTKN
jgi:uncharacterized membrane protein YqjE